MPRHELEEKRGCWWGIGHLFSGQMERPSGRAESLNCIIDLGPNQQFDHDRAHRAGSTAIAINGHYSCLLSFISLRTLVHLIAFHPRLEDDAITIKDHEIRSTSGLNHSSKTKVSDPVLGKALSCCSPTRGNSLYGPSHLVMSPISPATFSVAQRTASGRVHPLQCLRFRTHSSSPLQEPTSVSVPSIVTLLPNFRCGWGTCA